MQLERYSLAITYDGKDISGNLAKYLLDFSYSDAMSDQSDSVDITLEDKDGLWLGDWFPDKGAVLDITIHHYSETGSSEQMRIGKFELSEITCSGAPSVVKLTAVSVPDNTTLRGVDHSKSWEATTLQTIASDIASDAGMTLLYDVDENPKIERAEQTQQSDLSFLSKLCSDNGMSLKITDNQIAIFEDYKYEQKSSVVNITRGKSPYIDSWNFKSKLRDIYKACHVKYQNTKTKELIEYTFTDTAKKNGKTLELNEEVDDINTARKKAMKALRDKNKDEVTGSLGVPGKFIYNAGSCINIKNFGSFDGKYIITSAKHSFSGSGYTISIDIRRCLNGY